MNDTNSLILRYAELATRALRESSEDLSDINRERREIEQTLGLLPDEIMKKAMDLTLR